MLSSKLNVLHRIGAALCLYLCVFLPSQAAEIAGIKFPDSVRVGNTGLVLNGMGVRTFFVAKVYAMAVYAPTKFNQAEDFFANKPRKVIITTLREVDSNELSGAMLKSMRANVSREEGSAIANQMLTMGRMFSTIPILNKGDSLVLDYLPASGLAIYVNDKKVGDNIVSEKFMSALMKIWLGPKPADAELKNSLLGIAPAPKQTTHY